jgi:hypothetical protein
MLKYRVQARFALVRSLLAEGLLRKEEWVGSHGFDRRGDSSRQFCHSLLPPQIYKGQ